MAKVLMMTARLPYPPREGHQLRSWHLLRALASAHEVTLASFVRSDDLPDQCGPLRALVARLELFPIQAQQSATVLAKALINGIIGREPFVAHKYASAQMRARVAELAREADIVHVDMLPLIALLDEHAITRTPIVLNAHNVEHALLQQRAAIESGLPQRLFLRGQVAKLKAFEQQACRRAQHLLACSQDDADGLAALAPATPMTVVPNGVDVAGNRPGGNVSADMSQLVFVGQMGWFPNRDGVQWFLAEVFPRILAERPDARFVLVGNASGLEVPDAVRANVELRGFVDDLAGVLRGAGIYVVPLRSGSGTRLKVLEAMAFAKAIVTTHVGAQGIDLAADSEAVFADTAQDFAGAVLDLMAAPDRAARLGAAARAKAEARYDWAAIGRKLLATYARVLADQRVS